MEAEVGIFHYIWSMYVSGIVPAAVIFGGLRLITGLMVGDRGSISESIVSALLGGVLWPIAVLVILTELQAEQGIFWRSQDWKPQSERILDVLRMANREMTTREILEKDPKISDSGIYSRLPRLEKAKLVRSRRETDQEVEKYPPGDPRRKYRLRYWRITDKGLRRRVEKRFKWSDFVWNPMPRPA